MIIKLIEIHIDYLDNINSILHVLDNLDINSNNNKVSFFINDDDVQLLNKLNIPYQILINNVTEFYQKRNRNNENSRIIKGIDIYGSMGGYMTFKEIETKLQYLYDTFPDFISQKISIGKSYEGRDIWALHVSSKSLMINIPNVLITGLHHAREVITYTSIIYYIEWICKNYNKDKTAKYILDTKHLWFVPCLNPDGLVYNEKIAKNGGGLIRKNRRPTSNNLKLMGVDLNRNYKHKWNLNETGSSSNPNSIQYRGKNAFSEPETWALSLFARNRNIKLNINHHSYGNAILYPYGYSNTSSNLTQKEEQCYKDICKFVTQKLSNYSYGTGSELYYPVNGDASDWFHCESVNKGCILSFTTEIGNNKDGFWPKTNRIYDLCNEVKIITNRMCLLCDSYYQINHTLEDYYILLDIKNIGFINPKNPINIKAVWDNKIINLENDNWNLFIPSSSTSNLKIKYNILNPYFVKTKLTIILEYNNNNINHEITILSKLYLRDTWNLNKSDAFMFNSYIKVIFFCEK